MNPNGSSNGSSRPTNYRFDRFLVNERNRLLFKDGEEIPLTAKVLDILLVFLSNPGRVLGKDELIEKVWESKFVEEGNLARNVSTLRKALGGDAHDHRYVVTVPGRGYRFVADVSIVVDNESFSSRNGYGLSIARRANAYLPASNPYRLMLLLSLLTLLVSGFWFANSYMRESVTATSKEAKPRNPDAQQTYLAGRFLFRQSFDKAATADSRPLLLKSIENYQQAINIEPDFAPSYAGYARACQWLGGSGYKREYYFEQAQVAAKKAIELDETLAEAHGVLAFYAADYRHDLRVAEKEYTRAIELDPNSDYRHGYAMNLAKQGRIEEAINEIEVALRNDPSQVVVRQNAGRIYLEAGQTEKAIEEFSGVVNLAPQNPIGYVHLGIANVLAGHYDEGIAEINKYLEAEGDSDDRAILAWALARSGREDEAVKIAGEFSQKDDGHVPAMIYSGLGETEKALTELERECAKSPRTMTELRITAFYFNLTKEPRFQTLLLKLDAQS